MDEFEVVILEMYNTLETYTRNLNLVMTGDPNSDRLLAILIAASTVQAAQLQALIVIAQDLHELVGREKNV